MNKAANLKTKQIKSLKFLKHEIASALLFQQIITEYLPCSWVIILPFENAVTLQSSFKAYCF